MNKPVRLLLLGIVWALALLLTAGGLMFHAGVQTWAARRALAGQPQLKATLGELTARIQTVALHDFRIEQDGAIITVPECSAELSLIDAGLKQKISLRRLVAKGWTLDLTHYQFPPANTVPAAKSASNSPAALPLVAVAEIFRGVLARAALPFDLTLDGVELDGDVLLPTAPGVTAGRAHVVVTGGGLAAGREGTFAFTTTVVLNAAEVPFTVLTVEGRFAATMDTPRTFTRLTTHAEAAATGAQSPARVRLSAEIAATRTPTGENYALLLSDPSRLLVSMKADLPSASRRLVGTWKLAVRDADLAPFTLGRPLPTFALEGSGGFDLEVGTTEARASGKLDASVDKLGVIRAELAALGAVRLVSEFDLAHRGHTVRAEQFKVEFSGAQPVASVHALQPFEFNAATGELKVAEPARELLGLRLRGLPLAWVQPLVRGYSVAGADLHGEFVAIASNGGFALRPKTPLTIGHLTLVRAGQTLVQNLDFSLMASADYTPQGWQAEVAPLNLTSAGYPVLTVEAKVGQLSGQAQPVKTTGNFSADLPRLLAQPVAAGLRGVTAGEARGDFALSLGATQEAHVKLALRGLAAAPTNKAEKIPAVLAELRAAVATNGVVTLTAPLQIESEAHKSDLIVSGTLTPEKSAVLINAHVTSGLLVVDDVQQLIALVGPGNSLPSSPVAHAAAPPWVGLNGQVALALKKVVYSDLVQVSDVTGVLRLEAGAARLVNLKGGVGGGSEAKVNGGLTFNAQSPVPYELAAEVLVDEFDAARFFPAANPAQPATVEGKFRVATKLTGRAASLSAMAQATQGELQLTSKGGFFRGLPVAYAAAIEPTGKIAASVSAVGSLLGSVTGRKDSADIANRAQAVSEVTKSFNSIPYDQLNVVLVRDESHNLVLRDFNLISPELRLTGVGLLRYCPGRSLLGHPLAMEFKLRARGRPSELMRYLGVLEAQPDELGYTACSLPLKISGSIGQPDSTELNRLLTALALEKPGVKEKASELFNRLIGNGK